MRYYVNNHQKASSIKPFKARYCLFFMKGDGGDGTKDNTRKQKATNSRLRNIYPNDRVSTNTTRLSMFSMHNGGIIKKGEGTNMLEKLFEIEDQVKELKFLGENVENLEKIIENAKKEILVKE